MLSSENLPKLETVKYVFDVIAVEFGMRLPRVIVVMLISTCNKDLMLDFGVSRFHGIFRYKLSPLSETDPGHMNSYAVQSTSVPNEAVKAVGHLDDSVALPWQPRVRVIRGESTFDSLIEADMI